MTVRTEANPIVVSQLRNNEYARDPNAYYKYLPQNNTYQIFEPVPIAVQYIRWVRNVVVDWNWGLSTRFAVNMPVFDVLKLRIPVTLKLNLISLFFYIPIGFGLGILRCVKEE
ncbi:MAG: hypothetical protein MZU97_18305 [Bacillus subtilis]|nr:hypothetical protein [Bacillus subtilis]